MSNTTLNYPSEMKQEISEMISFVIAKRGSENVVTKSMGSSRTIVYCENSELLAELKQTVEEEIFFHNLINKK